MRTHRHPFLALPLLLSACKTVEAPAALEDLVVYGFVHFDEDATYLEAMATNLFPAVDDHLEEMTEGYQVTDLTADDLVATGVQAPDIEGIVGALGRAEYTHDLVDILCAATWLTKADVFETFLSYEVQDDGNRDCFLDGSCERYDFTVDQVVDVPILGEATQSISRSYRWVRPEDADPFVVSRGLAPDPISFSTNIMEVDQQYDFAVIYPRDGVTWRVETFWVEARIIGADVPDYFAVTSAVNEMQDQADRIDEFLDSGEGC